MNKAQGYEILNEFEIVKGKRCPSCGITQIYIRLDGTIRCRQCGYDGKIK